MALRFERLTRPAIRSLTKGQSITEHGITVAKTPKGDTRYTTNIMVDGQRIHRVVGTASEGMTREQAERAIEGFRTKAREGRLDLPSGRKVHRGFTEAAEAYLEQIEPDVEGHGRNITRKRAHIRQRLSPYFKQIRPDNITEFSIANYRRLREREGAAVSTINREVSTLSHFLGRCLAWRWTKTKPVIVRPDEPRKQITVLDESSKAALMQAAIGDQDPFTWLFVAIAMRTGMRHSEILCVRWDHINFDQRRIHIPEAKAGQRIQPIPPSLAAELRKEWEEQGEPSGWLFPTHRADAKHPNRQNMAQQFKRSVIRAGLNPAKVTPHILRHTAITELVKAGVDLPTIQKISGHKTLEMVLRYTQLSDEHIDESVAKLDAPFAGTITQELQNTENVLPIRKSTAGIKN